ncbi:sugar phosphate isomerase/epimerase [Alistipes sp. D31t1_170403_E11]|uniref:sugar phosphate isomerase/epimerase family protein n=1 Tax=Alistipes sp. D31t1_170403_E11 TaxID=2787128 RepID=UPI00189AB24E|nr:sugar phosphate isomerase/epimerase [Alistipes sp. D31t1_170403_E11]
MRNKLFAAICALLALAMLPGGAFAKAKKPPKKEIGIQLYSVRSLIGSFGKNQQDYKPVLKQLADMGYTSVEAASYKDGLLYGQNPEQFRKDVEAAGMKVLSTHCTLNLSDEELASGDFSKALQWWDECIAAHKAAGAEYIVVPSMRRIDNLKDLKTYCDYFNEIGARCKAAGMKFGYHNHSREYEKIEDQVMLDYMLRNTDPDKVLFEMDVYWTVIGKASPVAYFKKYPGRFKLLHIKDYREIGQSGMVGFDAIFANAETAGVENIIVEIEGSSYDDIVRSVRECIEYLQQAPFVEASYRK